MDCSAHALLPAAAAATAALLPLLCLRGVWEKGWSEGEEKKEEKERK